MRARCQAGFTLVEVLVASAILLVAAVPIFSICAGAQRLSRSQTEASDLQQRARVLAEKLQRDLVMAGAGPPHGPATRFGELVPPIVPARTGFRLADPELSAFADRVSILYVPAGGWDAPLAAPMTSPSAGVPIDAAAVGCPTTGFCGFTENSRALILDPRVAGGGFDLFTVTAIAGELAHGGPNAAFSQAYGPPARVMPIVQRTYYFDRAARRLMSYDGYQSDVPLLDNVADVRFAYFAAASPGPGLRPLSLSELSDGPAVGLPPNRFDADLRSIRLVRVTIRLEAGADDVRGIGDAFARPGRSTSGLSLVPDFEVTFDVAPRNMRASP